MTDDKSSRRTDAEASGPVLAWCMGPRCTALRRLAQPADQTGQPDQTDLMHSTIRQTRGAVLISSPCLGRCELASVAAVARRDGPSGQIGPLAWFTGLEQEKHFRALQAWILAGGPQQILQPARVLPPTLAKARCGVTAPPRIHRSEDRSSS